jgi:hypothetical protein
MLAGIGLGLAVLAAGLVSLHGIFVREREDGCPACHGRCRRTAWMPSFHAAGAAPSRQELRQNASESDADRERTSAVDATRFKPCSGRCEALSRIAPFPCNHPE